MGLGWHLWGWDGTYGAGGSLMGLEWALMGLGSHLWVWDGTYGAIMGT